jgi:putative MATE family efflux protein
MLENNFLFEKDFMRSLFKVAIPIAMQNIISFGVNAMDSVMLGKLGDVAVAGANLGGQPFFLLMVIGFGLAGGGSVMIAQYWGQGRVNVIRRIMRISQLSTFVLAGIFTFICYAFPTNVMRLFSHEDVVVRAAASYLKMLSLSFLVYSISNNYLVSLRAVESVRFSTLVYAMSFFVNVFANYAFIFGKFGAPKLGIVGAALGTVIARIFEFVFSIVYMYKFETKVGYKIHTMFNIDTDLVPDVLTHAIPVTMNESVWGIGAVVTNGIIGRIGSVFVAANSIAGVMSQLAQVMIFGIGNAALVVCGKIIGSGDYKHGQKAANTIMVLSFVFGILGSILILALRNPFLTLYNVTPLAKEYALKMMLILAMVQPIASLDTVNIVGILRGGGDAKTALALDACGMWLINIPICILLGIVLKLPAHWIFLGMHSDVFIKTMISVPRILSGKWIKNVTRNNV